MSKYSEKEHDSKKSNEPSKIAQPRANNSNPVKDQAFTIHAEGITEEQLNPSPVCN